MKNMNIVDNSLALTIRKEHRLMALHQVAHESVRVSKKVIFAIFALNLLNLFIQFKENYV